MVIGFHDILNNSNNCSVCLCVDAFRSKVYPMKWLRQANWTNISGKIEKLNYR